VTYHWFCGAATATSSTNGRTCLNPLSSHENEVKFLFLFNIFVNYSRLSAIQQIRPIRLFMPRPADFSADIPLTNGEKLHFYLLLSRSLLLNSKSLLNQLQSFSEFSRTTCTDLTFDITYIMYLYLILKPKIILACSF
jgi:hypothetical protein